jgi:hypothetical protein
MGRSFGCAGELAALNERLAGGDAITARKRIDYLRWVLLIMVHFQVVSLQVGRLVGNGIRACF